MLNTAKPVTPAFVLDPKKANDFFAFKGNSAKKHLEDVVNKRPQVGVDRFVRH